MCSRASRVRPSPSSKLQGPMPPKTVVSSDGATAKCKARGKADRKVAGAAAEHVEAQLVQQPERRKGDTKASEMMAKAGRKQKSPENKAAAAGAPQEAGRPAMPTKLGKQPAGKSTAPPTAAAAVAIATGSHTMMKGPKHHSNSHNAAAAAAGLGATEGAVGLPVPATAAAGQKKSASKTTVVAAAAAAAGQAATPDSAATAPEQNEQSQAAAADAEQQPGRQPSKQQASAGAAASQTDDPALPVPADAVSSAITVTVATWNAKHLSVTSVQSTVTTVHLEKLSNIARDIVRSGADIVVLQEVDQERAVIMLCAELMRLGALNKGDKGWCYALSNHLASGGYAERAAFVWRHGSRVRLVGVKEEAVAAASAIKNMHGQCSAFGLWEGSQPDHADCMGLKRAIYTGKFSVCTARGASKAQLHLSSLHIDCTGDTTLELSSRLPLLVEQMWEGECTAGSSAAGGRKKSDDPIIAVLGDFNRDVGHSDFSRLRDPAGCRLWPLLAPSVATNLSGNAQYDNAWVPIEQRRYWSGACVLAPAAEIAALPSREAVSRYSDHRLVYMVLGLSVG